MPRNKKGVKVDSNVLAWAKGRCHLLRSRSLEEKVWGGTLRACFRHVKLGCPLDIQVAGQLGRCICRAGLQGNSQGQRLTFGVIVSAWNLWHWVRSPMWWLLLETRKVPTRRGRSKKRVRWNCQWGRGKIWRAWEHGSHIWKVFQGGKWAKAVERLKWHF